MWTANWHKVDQEEVALLSSERVGVLSPRNDDVVRSTRRVFDRIWPLNRKPILSGMVRVIDQVDREQRRRRKLRDAADAAN